MPLTGKTTLENRLPEIAARMEAAIHEAVKKGADMVVETAKQRVPVDTGALQRAIHAEPDPDGGGQLVIAGGKDPETGADVFYGHIVEHGGVYTPAHPFLVPALEQNKAAIIATIAAAIHGAA